MITTQFLDNLAHDISEFGLDSRLDELRILADLAVRHEAGATLAGLLTDTDAPDVVRNRAFARVAAAVRLLPASMTTAA